MRFNHHSPYHWLVVAIVALVALFTIGPARGQGGNAATPADSRSALSSAQVGPGAHAGLPRGGIAVQGSEAEQKELTLVPRHDSLSRDVTSTGRVAKRAARRTVERSRTGVGGFDTSGIAAR